MFVHEMNSKGLFSTILIIIEKGEVNFFIREFWNSFNFLVTLLAESFLRIFEKVHF